MIRVGDLRQFSPLDGDTLAYFPEDRPRTVRLTLNAPQRTVLNVLPINTDGTIPDDAEPVFLAVVDGLEEVEFYVHGPYAIQAEADRVWLFTRDGSKIHTVVPDAESFTRITERRVRDPNIERMEQLLFQSNELRMGTAIREMQREFDRQLREREAVNLGTGAAGGDSPAPEPATGAGKSVSGTAPSGAGTEGGNVDPKSA